MRKLILAAVAGALGLSAMPAEAQRYGNYGYGRDYRHDVRDNRGDCRRALRRADNRWEYRRAQRLCQRSHHDRWADRRDWRYR
jgi:hypothetical protein